MSESGIRWPADLTPDQARMFGHNELHIDAPPAVIWAWLIRAERWHEYYGNCKNLRITNHAGPDLRLGSDFHWRTFGVPVHTVVDDFEPNRRLGWRGGACAGGVGYHGWLLEPDGGGTFVVTDEVQRGLIPTFGGWFLKSRLLEQHQLWLEGLARVATVGMPA